MQKKETIRALMDTRIVAIIRGFAPEICLKLAESYFKGGIRFVEVTFNQKVPDTWKDTTEAIRSIKARFGADMHVGAGTVLTEEQLELCAEAGGEYMIAPNVDEDLIRSCVARGMIAMPGAMTPSEAVSAWNAGAEFIKIFPAGSLGPGYIKALCAPLSHIPFLAVGGISPDNVADFMRAGSVGAGVSGSLSNKEWIAAGDWDKITAVARQLVENSKI